MDKFLIGFNGIFSNKEKKKKFKLYFTIILLAPQIILSTVFYLIY